MLYAVDVALLVPVIELVDLEVSNTVVVPLEVKADVSNVVVVWNVVVVLKKNVVPLAVPVP